MLKTKLLIISLSLVGCQTLSWMPPDPEIVQYAYKNAPGITPGFYGVNNKTQAHVFKTLDDPSMDSAQALSSDDYLKSEEWLKNTKQIMIQRCDP